MLTNDDRSCSASFPSASPASSPPPTHGQSGSVDRKTPSSLRSSDSTEGGNGQRTAQCETEPESTIPSCWPSSSPSTTTCVEASQRSWPQSLGSQRWPSHSSRPPATALACGCLQSL